MKLSKTVIFNSSARPLMKKEDIPLDLTREERYEIQIMKTPVFQAYLIPEQLEEYAYGRLMAEKIIHRKEDITFMRICDANRYHIQLSADINDRIHKTGSLDNYIRSLPKESWGDIISVRSMLSFTEEALAQTIDTALDNAMLHALAGQTFYAAALGAGCIQHLTYDTSPTNTLYKLYGQTGINSDSLILTNCPPSIETVDIIYKIRAPMAIFSGIPTNGAVNLAKKAGITLISNDKQQYLLFTDTARRIRNA